VTKAWTLWFCLLCLTRPPIALAAGWQPSPGHRQVPIWPHGFSDSFPVPGPEEAGTVKDRPIPGRRWIYVANVAQPTLTVYSPKGTNTGAAVIVFPGGGYRVLAIDLEGTEICEWLTSKGITCVLSKYRVPNSGPNWEQFCGCDPATRSSRPLEDAQRTISLVRFHAKEWHIDPHKIGVIGFSAGGHLVAAVSTRFDHRVYRPMDAADKESCRPDFAMALYPGHLYDHEKSALNEDIHVTAETPPTFIVHAQDDPIDGVSNSLIYYDQLRDAGVPTELHLFPEGGHAFGLRPAKSGVTVWPRLAEAWLRTIGMVPK